MDEAIKQELIDNGADVAGAIARMANNEGLFVRILLKFLDDKSFENLKLHVAEKNYEEIYKDAHTLKGVTSNLGLNKLTDASNVILNKVREENTEGLEEDLENVKQAYEMYQGIIMKLK